MLGYALIAGATVPSIEQFIYVEAPQEAVYQLVADLAQHARYLPKNMRYVRPLTPHTNQPGSRAEVKVQVAGPFWQSLVLQIHSLEPPRYMVEGPPEASPFLIHWLLSPEPPGTVVLVRTDFAPPGKGSGVPKVLAGRLEELLGRGQRDMLVRLKALAERQFPIRR